MSDAFFIRELPHYDGANTTYGSLYIEVDDGTDFSKHLTAQELVEGIAAKKGAITASNLTVSTGSRVLGRQNGSGGAVQELILGSAFGFSAGTLLVDHGGLQGLSDDDHPQYALRAGANISGTWNLADGMAFVFGATTGTKIGTGATQKIGFWNATPVVQPSAVADPSGGATVDTEARAAVADLLSRLRTLGLIAT